MLSAYNKVSRSVVSGAKRTDNPGDSWGREGTADGARQVNVGGQMRGNYCQ